MTWLHNESEVTEIPEGIVGFVYCITNTVDGRRYFGKKTFYFSKTKTIKGKKKRSKVESDWREYYGSSDELKKDVEKFGASCFKRVILYYCKNKGMMSYLELREQIDNRVLEKPALFYNRQIHCRIHQTHVKL
jgi:hypothetical protein